jgi:hypothetical protein
MLNACSHSEVLQSILQMQSQTCERKNYENYDLETQEERSTLLEVSPQTPAHAGTILNLWQRISVKQILLVIIVELVKEVKNSLQPNL